MDKQGPETGKQGAGAALERRQVRARRLLMQEMLVLSGELGYRAAREDRAHERSALSGLSEHFQSRDQCFLAAYEAEAERLYAILVRAAAPGPCWRDRVYGALTAFFAYVTDRPPLARALLVEVYVAGGAALLKHDELLECLSRAIDNSACRETPEPRHSPPPVTAQFMVGAIEHTARSFLIAGEVEKVWASLPELMHLVIGPYLGEDAAAEELERASPQRRL
jgi:AcrR family transcriptional regulator